jgi:hypothetical protein
MVETSELEVVKWMRASSQVWSLPLGQVEVVLLEVASPLSLYVMAISALPAVNKIGEWVQLRIWSCNVKCKISC